MMRSSRLMRSVPLHSSIRKQNRSSFELQSSDFPRATRTARASRWLVLAGSYCQRIRDIGRGANQSPLRQILVKQPLRDRLRPDFTINESKLTGSQIWSLEGAIRAADNRKGSRIDRLLTVRLP